MEFTRIYVIQVEFLVGLAWVLKVLKALSYHIILLLLRTLLDLGCGVVEITGHCSDSVCKLLFDLLVYGFYPTGCL